MAVNKRTKVLWAAGVACVVWATSSRPLSGLAGGAPVSDPAAVAIPHGKLVYKSDFSKAPAAHWWPRWTERTPVGDRPFLGQFGIEPVTFSLRDLPAHQFVRLHLKLMMFEPSDGSSEQWGPDVWELRVLGGPRLLYTTFDNVGFSYPGNNEQAFPDDFPWAIHAGCTGATEERNLGYPFRWVNSGIQQDCSSVYDMTLVFPHEGTDLRLLWQALWSERVKKGGESWGLESLEVEVLDGPQPLTEKQLDALWQDLRGDDAMKAFEAHWTLVSGGRKSAEFIAGRLAEAEVAIDPAKELDRLVKLLDDASFQVREQATQQMREFGRPHAETLRRLSQTSEAPEIRIRLRKILAEWERAQVAAPASPGRDRLRNNLGPARAVRTLETIGGPEVLKVLEAAAKGKSATAPFATAACQRLVERMLDDLLARGDAADKAGAPVAAAEEWGKQALAFAKAHLPEDERRAASVLEDWRLRREVRAAAAPADPDALRDAVLRRLAVGDDPAGAAQLAAKLPPPEDPKLAEALRLAAKPPEDLSLAEVRALREFYAEEAKSKTADVRTRVNLVARALAVARPGAKPSEERFDPAQGIDEALLVAWATDQAARGRWADLIDFMHLPPNPPTPNFVPQWKWQREWHGAIVGGNPMATILPVRLEGSFQVRFRFVPVQVGKFAVGVPVTRNLFVRATIYTAGGGAGIQRSDEAGDEVAAKWSPPELTAGGEYLADVTVRQEADGFVRVRLDIDGRTLVEWRGKATEARFTDSGCRPDLFFNGGRILLRTVAVRVLDGKAGIAQ
jgi:hypothetical protein